MPDDNFLVIIAIAVLAVPISVVFIVAVGRIPKVFSYFATWSKVNR